ncbi:MAG: Methionine aminopeptidase 1 [Phycisphaerae bacterium]|nr:Methionine aminopeptidase 1 [Phycisphaerae bacterium]
MGVAAGKVVVKSPREVELMRDAGRVVCRVLDALGEMIRPGVTTAALDAEAARIIREAGATALFLGVRNPQARFPFPASICSSVNDEVVHGIPGPRELREGDIVSVDCGVRLKGYCGDAARTYAVGPISALDQQLLDVTRACLTVAVEQMRPGVRWSAVARQIQDCAERAEFGVVREFVGHGIGREMHEDPKVPNYDDRRHRRDDFELVPGMTLAVEPMVTAGRPAVEFKDSARWTVATKDGSNAAHFEHTIAVTPSGNSVLTDGR